MCRISAKVDAVELKGGDGLGARRTDRFYEEGEIARTLQLRWEVHIDGAAT